MEEDLVTVEVLEEVWDTEEVSEEDFGINSLPPLFFSQTTNL
jgi:hypothetical protein